MIIQESQQNTQMYKDLSKVAQYFRELSKEATALTINKEIYEKNKKRFVQIEDEIDVLSSFCIYHLERILCSLDDAHKEFAHNELHSIYEQIGQILKERNNEEKN